MFCVSEPFYFLSVIPRATVLGTMSLKYVQLEGGGSWRFAEGHRARRSELWSQHLPCGRLRSSSGTPISRPLMRRLRLRGEHAHGEVMVAWARAADRSREVSTRGANRVMGLDHVTQGGS